METAQVKILLVDDDEDDFVITRDLLREIDEANYTLEWTADYREALHLVAEQRHDVYLFDYRLGERSGLHLLQEAVAEGCPGPIILLTGQGDREVDLQAMRSGAADYLAKGQLNAPLLERAIRYALERRRAEQKLTRMAQYDLLTGLANRFLLQDRLRQAITLARRDERMVGLLFLDLDKFKSVNDTFGHAVGDLLLQAVAERLRGCVRDCDTLARVGGDEFVVVAPALVRDHPAAAMAQRIVTALKEPFQLEGRTVHTGTSVGIALFPEDGEDADALLKAADAAMYRAKEGGGGGYQFFCAEVNQQIRQRLHQESALRRALEREEFLLHYQPQIELASGRMVGVEVLLRWNSPDRGLLQPPQFLPLLEESGLLVSVGRWVVETAAAQYRAWEGQGLCVARLAVNLSACQLIREELRDMLRQELGRAGMPLPYLELELTETAALAESSGAPEILRQLKELGVRLAIDDFGTGRSSLTCLRELPVDRVKIAPGFVRNIGREPRDEAIIRGIIDLAHNLGVGVVAEGVETVEQAGFLREQGCDEAQGFHFGRPLPAEEFGRRFGAGEAP